MALAGSGNVPTAGRPFRRLTPVPQHPQVAGTEEPQTERAVSPESTWTSRGFFFCGGQRKRCQYRDGLLLALVTIWPIRRRGLAALTVSRHLEFDDGGVNILLYLASRPGRALNRSAWRAGLLRLFDQLSDRCRQRDHRRCRQRDHRRCRGHHPSANATGRSGPDMLGFANVVARR
jgi:hypothetical protein